MCLTGLECRSGLCVQADPDDTGDASTLSAESDADASASTEAGPSGSDTNDTGATSTAGDTASGGCQGSDGTIDCPCLGGNDCLGDLECDSEQTCVCLSGTACGDSDCVEDFETDNRHCGTCGNECTVFLGSLGACAQGECAPTWGECVPAEQATTCDAICREQGETCVVQGCGQGPWTWIKYATDFSCEEDTSIENGQDACDADLATALEPMPGEYMRCCCTQ